MRRQLIAIAALLLVGCAHQAPPAPAVPLLHLSPASLGRELMLAQRLSVLALPNAAEAAADAVHERSLETQLQVDTQSLQLAAIALNQRVMRLAWDGQQLTVERHPLLPAEVDPERVLRDLQLSCWPLAAVQAVLPAGWQLADANDVRELTFDGQVQVRIEGVNRACRNGRITLDNRREGYRLSIESREME